MYQRENFQHLKAQCGYHLARFVNESMIYVECEISPKHKDMIIEELDQLKTYKSDDDGKLKILPKPKIKENIGRSPDFLDNFIMRMYFVIQGY